MEDRYELRGKAMLSSEIRNGKEELYFINLTIDSIVDHNSQNSIRTTDYSGLGMGARLSVSKRKYEEFMKRLGQTQGTEIFPAVIRVSGELDFNFEIDSPRG